MHAILPPQVLMVIGVREAEGVRRNYRWRQAGRQAEEAVTTVTPPDAGEITAGPQRKRPRPSDILLTRCSPSP